MSRNRQRRKERRAAANGEQQKSQGDPGDKKLTAADVSMPTEEREAFDQGVAEQMTEDERERGEQEDRELEAGELIEALDVLRQSRANPLTAGITVFTAMLGEARAGYAADRLAELEAALSLEFNAEEAQGVVQVAMASMDETGIPDVEHGIELCLRARVEVGADPVAEDHGDESQVDGATEQDRIDEVREAEERAREDHNAGVEQEEDAEQAEIEAEEAEADKPGPED